MELNADELRMRLACREPDEEVGTPGSPYDCLIARDLEGVTGRSWIVVPRRDGSGYYGLMNQPNERYPLPKWANTLALAFDSLGFGQPTTAKQALTLFDEVVG